MLDAIEFHRMLKMKIVDISDGDSVCIRLPFSPRYVLQSVTGNYHGGVLASLADIAGTAACIVQSAKTVMTTHLSINFLKSPRNCDLYARAKVIKFGAKNMVADIEITDEANVMYAVARGSWSDSDASFQQRVQEVSDRQPSTNLGLLGIEQLANNERKTAIINVRANGSVCETSYGELHANFNRVRSTSPILRMGNLVQACAAAFVRC
jgi:uncharacterized protein (TIGR00369 family)